MFEDDYELMSLDEIESFVKKEKHLPEIASAEEMKQNGLSITEFQIQLLQKIEELTLYTISINNQVKELKEENEELKATLAEIISNN
ncbi:MAG: hypothetical protein RJQ09_11915 [Cyclobacteriaceae bacterium]